MRLKAAGSDFSFLPSQSARKQNDLIQSSICCSTPYAMEYVQFLFFRINNVKVVICIVRTVSHSYVLRVLYYTKLSARSIYKAHKYISIFHSRSDRVRSLLIHYSFRFIFVPDRMAHRQPRPTECLCQCDFHGVTDKQKTISRHLPTIIVDVQCAHAFICTLCLCMHFIRFYCGC